MLTKRQQKILNLIVGIYGESQVPVGSKLLMENIKASSATIRNDMNALEKYGFLKKEHLSSGRIPSVDGYKYFIENFLEPNKLDKKTIFNVMQAFDHDFYRVSDIFETGAKLLAKKTGFTSFVLGIPPKDQILSNFDIVILDNHSALAVMTMATGIVKTNQFVLPSSLTDKSLKTISDIVHSRLVGKRAIDIHYALMTEIPQILAKYFQVTDGILELFEDIFSVLYTEDIHVSRKHDLFDYTSRDEKLYQLLSDNQNLTHELRKTIDGEAMRVIKIDEVGAFENLTVIAQKFIIPYRGTGTIAVITPIDTYYDKIVSIVDLIAKILSMKLADYYRYLDGNHYEVQR